MDAYWIVSRCVLLRSAWFAPSAERRWPGCWGCPWASPENSGAGWNWLNLRHHGFLRINILVHHKISQTSKFCKYHKQCSSVFKWQEALQRNSRRRHRISARIGCNLSIPIGSYRNVATVNQQGTILPRPSFASARRCAVDALTLVLKDPNEYAKNSAAKMCNTNITNAPDPTWDSDIFGSVWTRKIELCECLLTHAWFRRGWTHNKPDSDTRVNRLSI